MHEEEMQAHKKATKNLKTLVLECLEWMWLDSIKRELDRSSTLWWQCSGSMTGSPYLLCDGVEIQALAEGR